MKLAIVGVFYDGYSDMWEDFLKIFRMNWPKCPYPLYIVNQEAEPDYISNYNVSVLHAGKNAEYSKKIKTAVDKIDADYYLLLLEDYFIGETIKEDILQPVLDFIVAKNVKYLGFSMNLYGPDKKKYFKPKKITPKSEYTIVSGNNIVEKNFLRNCVGDENFKIKCLNKINELKVKSAK